MTNGMEIEMKAKNSAPVRTQAPLKRRFKRYLPVYLIALPGIVYLIINNYMPMIGLVLAFKKYSFAKGIFGSPWNGLKTLNGPQLCSEIRFYIILFFCC